MPITVQSLYIYPVKSCQGIRIDKAHITPTGLQYDREFAIFQADDNTVQDIRIQPKLCTLRPGFERDPTLRVPLRENRENIACEKVCVRDRHGGKWYGGSLVGICCGQEAADWVTQVVEHHALLKGNRYRLVRYSHAGDSRRIRNAFRGKSLIAKRASLMDSAAFADCAPYHLLSEETLGDLNERLVAAGEHSVTMAHFRPNIVISGAGPYIEDEWENFTISPEIRFRKLGVTGRCVIPTTHPFTGIRDSEGQPRAMLASYREMPYGDGPHGGPAFGVWLACDALEGVLNVGQHLHPLPPKHSKL